MKWAVVDKFSDYLTICMLVVMFVQFTLTPTH